MKKEKYKKLINELFEDFQRSYIEDARDEAKMNNEDEYEATREFETKDYREFENYMFDHICAFFEGSQ